MIRHRWGFGAPAAGGVGWSGLEASLIEIKSSRIKQKTPPIDYGVKASEDDQSKKKAKLAGEGTAEYMYVDAVTLPGQEMKHSCAREVGHPKLKVFPCNVYLECDEVIHKVATCFTESVQRCIKWDKLKSVLPGDVYDKLEKDVFCSIAKAVLTIFDQEDFANVCVTPKRCESYVKLCEELRTSLSKVGILSEKRDAVIGSLSLSDILDVGKKAAHYSIETIAEKNDPEQFAGLVESDFLSFLRFAVSVPPSGYRVDAMISQRNMVCSVISRRIKDFQEYNPQQIKEVKTVPLKEGYKAQLHLELASGRGYYVMDYLFVEACKGFMSGDLFKALDEGLEGEDIKTSAFLADCLVFPVRRGLFDLGYIKTGMLRNSLGAATCAFSRGPYGPAAKDVIKVIEVADYERRNRRRPFIDIDDILFGLSISRLGHHGLVESAICDTSAVNTSPGMPPYKIYKLAKICAENFGSTTVELEHLVLAVTKVKKGDKEPVWSLTDLESLKKMKDAPVDSKIWKDPGFLLFHGKDIFGYENLVEALRNGSIEFSGFRISVDLVPAC